MSHNREKFALARRSMSRHSIPELIELLESADLRTRFLAEMCLRDATATWLNFQPAAQAQERERAIEEWRVWWQAHSATFKKRWQHQQANDDEKRKWRETDGTDNKESAMKNSTMPTHEEANYRERVYEIVRRIPQGRVMTYGQIAELLGEGYTPRTVGFVMHAAEATTPWQRVINSQGACSTGRVILPPDKQQRMLEAEGIKFDARGRCDLTRYRWIPDETVERANDERAEAQASLFAEWVA